MEDSMSNEVKVRQCAGTAETTGERCLSSAYGEDRLCNYHKNKRRAMAKQDRQDKQDRVARGEAAGETTTSLPVTMHLDVDTITAHFPQVRRWRDFYERAERELRSRGLAYATVEEAFDHLIMESIGEIPTIEPDIPEVEDPEASPEEAILEYLRTKYLVFSTTLGHGIGANPSPKWVQIKEMTADLPFHQTTVRRYAEILWRQGKVRSRLAPYEKGRSGRRPRLFAYKPSDEELAILKGGGA